jgi:hypothetical protein
MASQESEALKTLYRGWAAALAANPEMPLDELRLMFEHWGDVTAEPGGVDYIETNTGSPAPKPTCSIMARRTGAGRTMPLSKRSVCDRCRAPGRCPPRVRLRISSPVNSARVRVSKMCARHRQVAA